VRAWRHEIDGGPEGDGEQSKAKKWPTKPMLRFWWRFWRFWRFWGKTQTMT
jgi:hypothetical protein